MFVYIAEAHACDEWPVGHPVLVRQTHTTEERLGVARQRLKDLGVGEEFARLVDLAEHNEFHAHYACWPLRWYMVEGGGRALSGIAQPRFSGYDVAELVGWVVRQATDCP